MLSVVYASAIKYASHPETASKIPRPGGKMPPAHPLAILLCLLLVPICWATDPPRTTCLNPFVSEWESRQPRNETCYIFADELQIFDSKVSVHYLENWLPSPDPPFTCAEVTILCYPDGISFVDPKNIRDKLISTTHQTLQYYSSITDESPTEIIFIYQNSASNEEIWTSSDSPEEPCYINVNFSPSEVQDMINNVNNLQFYIARRIYLCFQRNGGIGRPASSESSSASAWWRYGSADFFARGLFVTTTFPNPFLWYNFDIPLAGFPDHYDGYHQNAALFFLYLSNAGWKDTEIHDWVVAQHLVSGPVEELERVSEDPRISESWQSFILATLHGTITHKDGRKIPMNLIKGKLSQYNIDKWRDRGLSRRGYYDDDLTALAYTLDRMTHATNVALGDLLNVNFTTNDERMTVIWRTNNGPWTEFPKNMLVELPGSATGSDNITYNFLPLTTTYKYQGTGYEYTKGSLHFTRPTRSQNTTVVL